MLEIGKYSTIHAWYEKIFLLFIFKRYQNIFFHTLQIQCTCRLWLLHIVNRWATFCGSNLPYIDTHIPNKTHSFTTDTNYPISSRTFLGKCLEYCRFFRKANIKRFYVYAFEESQRNFRIVFQLLLSYFSNALKLLADTFYVRMNHSRSYKLPFNTLIEYNLRYSLVLSLELIYVEWNNKVQINWLGFVIFTGLIRLFFIKSCINRSSYAVK